jgi:hypothetical protein
MTKYFEEWIKSNPTADESLPPDATTAVAVDIHRRVLVRDGKSPSSETTTAPEEDSRDSRDSRDLVGKKRRIALYAGCCCMVLLAIAIAVGVLLAMGVFENESRKGKAEVQADFESTTGSRMPSDFLPLAPSVAGTMQPTTSRYPLEGSSSLPVIAPSMSPSSTVQPTISPITGVPSTSSTWYPTVTYAPVARPPVVPMDLSSKTLLTFCVIADVPYTQEEADEIPNQIATQMDGCEFLVHLGDLFDGDTQCDEEYYDVIRDIMLESKIPTFVVLGDNEWNDCQREMIEVGWERWVTNFMYFENNWTHNFTVARQPGYEENFYFMYKRTLVIGLNLVGGRVHNATEWSIRMEDEFHWTRNVIHLNLPTGNVDGVIILSHAKPTEDHLEFTVPFRSYLAKELKNKYPILYLHADGHSYMYTPYFLQQPNLLRVQHEGGVRDPILKVLADPARYPNSVYSAFQLDRQLSLDAE